ncbi:MAG TPA: hypothetical protein VFL97_05595 [Nitrococcus sp.]|nr:hypothetical protein [Nitrococcus sp.]
MSRDTPSITTTARRLLDICLLRATPQELPRSWELFGLTLIASLGLSYPAALAYGPGAKPMAEILAGLLFTLGFIYGTLAFRGFKVRFIQTASAVFGTDAIITLAALPALHAISMGAAQDTFTLLAMAGIGIWNLLVLGHILRHALALPFPGGILVALGYILGSVFISQLILG